jgi:hypothetical protein
MNEDKNSDIEQSIFQLLTEKANVWISVNTLYNKYTNDVDILRNKKNLVDKKLFIILCKLLDTRYRHIKKMEDNNTTYLAFSTFEEPDDPFPIEKDSKSDHNLEVNTCDVIEYMLKNPATTSTCSFTEYFDSEDTILHIVCRNNNINLLDYILRNYDVDINIKNKNNERPIDVVNIFEKNSIEIIKMIKDYELKNLELNYEISLKNIKVENSRLVEVSNKLNEDITNYKYENERYKDNFSDLAIVYVILLFIGMLYIFLR